MSVTVGSKKAVVVVAVFLVTILGVLGDLPPPVVCLAFDGTTENSGSGGSGYNAVLSGTASYTDGIDGQGLRLDGAGYAGVACQLPGQGAITLWFTPDVFFDYNSVFDNSVHQDKWELWFYKDARLRVRIDNGTGDITVNNFNNKLNGTNQWYHIAYVWDNVTTNRAWLYVNGVEQGSAAITAWVVPGNTFYIGGGHSGNNNAKGIMDDVRVYDTALTAAQVQAVHAEVASKAPVVRLTLGGVATNSGTGGPRYDAALQGDPAPVWTNGWNNKRPALALYGSNDYAAVAYRLPASGSVALWYYAQGPWYNHNSVFDNSVNADDYECWIDNGGKLYFRTTKETTSASYSLGGGNSNRWYHIVGTWDALSRDVVLYVNGVERGRSNTGGTAWPLAGTSVFVGGGNAGNTSGTGIASDFQIFETPLSSNRVAEVYGEIRQLGGLLAYVPFDGTAEDVVYSNTVVLGGSPSYVKTQSGLLKGLSCKGVGSSDNAAISNVLGSTVGTIALWYYARGPWYNHQTIFDNLAGANHWESWIYNDGRITFRASELPGAGLITYSLNNLNESNSWYHIAYTWNLAEGQTRLFVNGEQRGTAAFPEWSWVAPNSTLFLAGGHTSNSKGNGIWDEVRVYDRELTKQEIEVLMVIPPDPPWTGTMIRVR